MNVRNHWVPLFEKHKINAVFENDHHTFKRTHPILKDKVDKDKGILYLAMAPGELASEKFTNLKRNGTSPRQRAETISGW